MNTKAEPVSSGQPLNLHPLNDCVLVELKQSSNNFTTKEGRYDSRTEGIVVEIEKTGISQPQAVELGIKDYHFLIGKRIHFEEYKEGARIKRDGKIYSFIKIADIRGYEEA